MSPHWFAKRDNRVTYLGLTPNQHGFDSGFLSDLKAWEDGEAVSVQVVSGDEIYMEPHPLRTIQLSPAVQ